MLKRELDDLKEDEWALATTGAHGDVTILKDMGLFPSDLGRIGNRDMVALRASAIVDAAAAELQGAMMEAKAKRRAR